MGRECGTVFAFLNIKIFKRRLLKLSKIIDYDTIIIHSNSYWV